MKKLIALLLAAGIAATLVSCSSEKDDVTEKDEVVNEETASPEQNKEEKEEVKEDANDSVYEDVDLLAIADSLYAGIADDEKPMTMSMPLEDAETFMNFAFIEYEEDFKAVVNEPMIGSIAHSVILVKCPTVEKAKEVAAAMKENCNPRKWVCVGADIVEGVTNGNIAMLLMTTTEGGMSETILSNFASLNEEKIASLGSEVFEEIAEDAEAEVEDEVAAEDVVVELPEVDAGDAPAAMPEEDNTPAVMPEVTPEEETVEESVPETIVVPDNAVVVYPEDENEADNTPAVMPEEPKSEEEAPEAPEVSRLDAIKADLYKGISEDELPMLIPPMELDAANFMDYAFIPYKDTYKAFVSEPAIATFAHSVVVVETANADEAAKVAAEMKSNCNPKKNGYVEADVVIGTSYGKYAVLIMSDSENMDTDKILANIKAAVK